MKLDYAPLLWWPIKIRALRRSCKTFSQKHLGREASSHAFGYNTYFKPLFSHECHIHISTLIPTPSNSHTDTLSSHYAGTSLCLNTLGKRYMPIIRISVNGHALSLSSRVEAILILVRKLLLHFSNTCFWFNFARS